MILGSMEYELSAVAWVCDMEVCDDWYARILFVWVQKQHIVYF